MFIKPQLAHTAKTLDEKTNAMAFEPKLDGFRAIISKTGEKVTIFSRTEKPQDGKLPHLEALFAGMHDDFVLDGEIIYEKSRHELHGKTVIVADFNKTMKIMGAYPDKAVPRQEADQWLKFIAFDLLSFKGMDVTGFPDEYRRGGLELFQIGMKSPHFELSTRWDAGTWKPEWYDELVELGAEGAMLKDPRATYQVGKRSHSWLKHKMVADADVVFMGITEGQNALEGLAGAIIFGQYKDGVLVERGKCSGMNAETRDYVTVNAEHLARNKQVFTIKYNGFVLDGGAFRHPQYKDSRDDKTPEECTWT